MLMLGQAQPQTLKEYALGVERLHEHYGQWSLLAQAESRMREEHWNRLRAEIACGDIAVDGFNATAARAADGRKTDAVGAAGEERGEGRRALLAVGALMVRLAAGVLENRR